MQKKRASTDYIIGKSFDSSGCPFREFKDSELGSELWGLGPEALHQRLNSKYTTKNSLCESVWDDDQIQPLPRTARKSFHEWIRAEELAGRWEATLVVSRESVGTENSKMRSHEFQTVYADIIQRSSFCRKALSCCYNLERVENFVVEHQWENFICAVGSDGWLPRLHILSPGMKPGGGSLHKPSLSKSGCYLVRLYYLGAWRCVWVSDLVPMDHWENPLLPFAQPVPPPQPSGKNPKPQPVIPQVVQLWPLLLLKALLKLAALDIFDNEGDGDEAMEHLDIMHCLTGALILRCKFQDQEQLWSFMKKEAAVFAWEIESDSPIGTVRGKPTKKPAVKNTSDVLKLKAVVSVELIDTLGVPSYELPGLTPAYDLALLALMIRDLPLVKPPDEPEVPLWKTYRWVKWARSHGLYDEYECPRKRWIKAVGLLRLSRSPHLLDVKSTESISNAHAKELDKARKRSDTTTLSKGSGQPSIPGQTMETMEWIDFKRLYNYVKQVNAAYLPSMHQYFSVGNALSPRIPSKGAQAKPTDLQAPTNAPLYLQVDSEEPISFRISLSTIHPRILCNSGYPLTVYVKPAHLILEKFSWLSDEKKPINASAYLETRSYDTLEINLPPGRHIFRLWVTSALAWHCCILSEASLNLCKRNIAFGLATAECSWATQKMSDIDSSFLNWIKCMPVRNPSLSRLFYKSYAPDLCWNPKTVGCPQTDVHSMFRKALSTFLQNRLPPADFHMACNTLRTAFIDPYFGLNQPPGASLETLEVFRNACDISRAKCFCEGSLNVDSQEELELQEDTASSLNDENIEHLRKFVVNKNVSNDCIHCDSIINKVQNILLRHQAATVIQSNWRKIRCRRMYTNHSLFYPDIVKTILDQVCSTTGVSALMSTFFKLFPEVCSAYSISSALGGRYGYQQYPGVSVMTAKDIWIPLFIGTFYCHSTARVHFDLECILRKCTVVIIDNDSRTEVPVVVNSKITYDFNPNVNGYDVHAHAWRTSLSFNQVEEVFWRLTLLSSEQGAFHICDNALPICEDLLLSSANKFELEENFVPNRRNIVGAVQLLVLKSSSFSIRVTSNYPELNLLVILRERSKNLPIAMCCGRGELFWSPVGLEPHSLSFSGVSLRNNGQQGYDKRDHESSSKQTLKHTKKPNSGSSRKSGKIKAHLSPVGPEPKVYEIEVIAPEGWPLTSAQWLKVDEERNHADMPRPISPKRAKHVETDHGQEQTSEASPGDANCRFEVSLAPESHVSAQRDNCRDLAWKSELDSWEKGTRHARGALFREKFRDKYLIPVEHEDPFVSAVKVDNSELSMMSRPRVSSKISTISRNVTNERYLTKPEHLEDKFQPLEFVPLCRKAELPESVTLTPEAAEAALQEMHVRIEESKARGAELQDYNLHEVILVQRRRNYLLHKLFVDGNWRPRVAEALQARDEAGGAMPRRASSRSLRGKKK